MKKVILLVVILLVLAGGAVGAMYFMQLGPFEPKEPVKKTQEEIELEKEATTTTVAIKPFNIPIFQGERVAGSIQVQFELEVPIGQEEAINEKMVRLEDAYLRDLYVYLPQLLRNKETLDVLALKRRLKRVSEKIVGPDIIEDVLIQSVADGPG